MVMVGWLGQDKEGGCRLNGPSCIDSYTMLTLIPIYFSHALLGSCIQLPYALLILASFSCASYVIE